MLAYQLQFGPVLRFWPDLLQGTINTLQLSAQSIALGVVLGLIGAIARTDGPAWLRALVAAYVEVFRNTPLLVQLFLVFFGLPLIGLRFSADTAAVLAIALNLGAYSTEIFRAGLQAIPRTQIEAGLALGLSRLEVMRHIVIIPALRIIYPAITGQLTLTLLGTSMASAISARELTMAGRVIESFTFRSFEAFIIIGIVYIGLTFAFRFVYYLIGLWLFRRKAPPRPRLVNPIDSIEAGR